MNPPLRLALLICIVWSGQLRAQVRINGLYKLLMLPKAEKHGLKGRVRVITQRQSPVSQREEDLLDGFSGQNYTEKYNRRGYLQKHISHDDFNKPRSTTNYAYDAGNRVTATWVESLAPDQFGLRTDGRVDYECDDARNAFITRDNRTVMGRILHRRIETVRDTVNRILTSREYRGGTLLTQYTQYWWDNRGYVTKHVSQYRNLPPADSRFSKEDITRLLGSPLSEREERALDSLMRAKDSLQTQRYKSRPEWMMDTTIYQNEYDKRGRFIRQELYRNSKRTDVVSYTYGPDATQVIRQSFDRAGNLISENTSRQHPVDRHMLTDSSRHTRDGKWETSTHNYEKAKKPVYQYQYDSRGNWTEQKQVDVAGKQIGPALVRFIDYY